MQESGEFGRGGHRHVHARMVFEGEFTQAFETFLRDKALRLSLPFRYHARKKGSVTVETSGAEALVGALEMSAIVGPGDCMVDAWQVEMRPADPPDDAAGS